MLKIIQTYLRTMNFIRSDGNLSLFKTHSFSTYTFARTAVGACSSIVVKALNYKPAGRGFETRSGE
jgi:hypothetical protein